MHVDAVIPPSLPLVTHSDGYDDQSDKKNKAPRELPSWKTPPREDGQAILPSNPQDEDELRISGQGMDVDTESAFEHTSPDPQHSIPVSPPKSRTSDIIARIKAKAEADAAAQIQEHRRLSSLGLLSSESASDLSSLSSEEDDLELELSDLGNANISAVCVPSTVSA